ncbi:DUF3375 domain-containing protein [Thorsellia anophelis]|uniref:DUF3375 domain-containing protein n=1 Tax=Thorsellia anophelis DSM 18579 TaxID=1123402 RepID=A0A1I0EZ83_9GAMM|nr:DUF3375 domain-containing protein [Thorsellia anophelis]SET50985.1 Protein of unknown function [Thorsellia anophelis DSM 18579]
MSFQGFQAKYKRLYSEHAAWKLLKTDNAPYILAFIASLFQEESEIEYGKAKIILDEELKLSRELGIWSTETSAGTYLNQWIRQGWLREMDDTLTKTDASEIALRFCKGLDERGSSTTASHLRIVQEAVRDLALAMNPSIDQRVELLEHKKQEIQKEIDALNAGHIVMLTELEQKERIREIYQLASVLTGDFRRVEDEIRLLDKSLRVQIVEGSATRGDILLSVMEKEALLASTESGSAFEGFFQLLCDQNRTTEFREQLRSILQQPSAKQLLPQQTQFLSQLMRELSKESDRVFRVRRRTEEGLRSYIESGAALENRAVDRLLSQLERHAILLRDENIDLKTNLSMELHIGPLEIGSPESMRLRTPEDKLDMVDIKTHINSREPSADVLASLETVQIRELAMRIVNTLRDKGPSSIGMLIEINPIQSGLEELVAYLRVAKAINAAQLQTTEKVIVRDKHGNAIEATIPTYLLSLNLFPETLDELSI